MPDFKFGKKGLAGLEKQISRQLKAAEAEANKVAARESTPEGKARAFAKVLREHGIEDVNEAELRRSSVADARGHGTSEGRRWPGSNLYWASGHAAWRAATLARICRGASDRERHFGALVFSGRAVVAVSRRANCRAPRGHPSMVVRP